MAQFPTKEAEILALAQDLTAGLTAETTTYPALPVSTDELKADTSAYIAARDAAVSAQAAAEQATAAKDEALQTLSDNMKTDLRYAENTVRFDDDKLKRLGWGGRKARTSLIVPGQCRSLESPRQGEGWIYLDWKAPSDGGKVAAYKIQRRQPAETAWTDIGMAVESEITLTDQDRGKQWEYRIIAVNKAGEGEPGNTVAAVL